MRVALAAALVFTACGSSGGSAGGDVTSLDGNRTLGSLTRAEKTQLCRDIEAYKARVVTAAERARFACALQGLSTGDAVACRASIAACQQSTAPPVTPVDCATDDAVAMIARLAAAPVSAATACAKESIVTSARLVAGDPCVSKAGDGGGIAGVTDMMNFSEQLRAGPACTALAAFDPPTPEK